jgi:hypothetical protein
LICLGFFGETEQLPPEQHPIFSNGMAAKTNPVIIRNHIPDFTAFNGEKYPYCQPQKSYKVPVFKYIVKHFF